MLTTLAVKIVVKTVTKVSTVMKFELSEVEILSKANSKCQDAKNDVQIGTSPISFLYFHRLQAYLLTPSISRNTESVSNAELHEAGKGQNMRTTLLRPPTYVNIQFHPTSVLPAFLLPISNFIQTPPSLFLSPLRPYDIQTNTRAKIMFKLRRGCRDANLYNQIYFPSWQVNSCDTHSACRLYALTLTVTRTNACLRAHYHPG
jgi:hypothetical protein